MPAKQFLDIFSKRKQALRETFWGYFKGIQNYSEGFKPSQNERKDGDFLPKFQELPTLIKVKMFESFLCLILILLLQKEGSKNWLQNSALLIMVVEAAPFPP